MTFQDFINYMKNTKKILEKSKFSSEPDTKSKVIEPLLNLLGYNENDIIREAKEGISQYSVDYSIPNKKTESIKSIPIEAKNINTKLTKSVCKDFTMKYMLYKTIVFGILTNGKIYKLFGKPFSNYYDELELYSVDLDIINFDERNEQNNKELYNSILLFLKDTILHSQKLIYIKALSQFLVYQRDKCKSTDPYNVLRAYKNEIVCFINYLMNFFPNIEFTEVNNSHFKSFADYRLKLSKKKGLIKDANRLRTILSYVSSFLKYCNNEKLFGYYNPQINEIPLEKFSYERFNACYNQTLCVSLIENLPLKLSEIEQVISYCKQNITECKNKTLEEYFIAARDYIFFLMPIFTGCKRNELKNLKWCHINFQKESILLSGKEYGLSSFINHELLAYKIIFDKYYKTYKQSISEKYLFLTSAKYYKKKSISVMNDSKMNYCLEKTLKNANIPIERIAGVTIQGLRNTNLGLVMEQIREPFAIILKSVRPSTTVLELMDILINLDYNVDDLIYSSINYHPLNKTLQHILD